VREIRQHGSMSGMWKRSGKPPRHIPTLQLEASIPRRIRDFCPGIIDRLSGPERLDRDKIYTRRFMNVPMNFRRSTRFSRLSTEEKVGSTLLRLGFWLYDRRPFRAEK
jgi:hypothetical protein